jgi:hypothetical protein
MLAALAVTDRGVTGRSAIVTTVATTAETQPSPGCPGPAIRTVSSRIRAVSGGSAGVQEVTVPLPASWQSRVR